VACRNGPIQKTLFPEPIRRAKRSKRWEHHATADAYRLLATLAAGSAGPRVATSAKESLGRMGAKIEGSDRCFPVVKGS
jgi:hypothetical protein